MGTVTSTDINEFIENLVGSYEERLHQIESVFTASEAIAESSHNLLNDFQKSFRELREERNNLTFQLRENLAINGSLRRKDYDKVMDDFLLFLKEKEEDAEKHFFDYVEEQKSMARSLKTGLLELNSTPGKMSVDKIEEFKESLHRISKDQETRKEFVLNQFLKFQEIHNTLSCSFKNLLDKVDDVRMKDIKMVINNIVNN
ncbi:MAG: hypothetical protein ACEPOZ_19395 [Marinifilaceae bacterium]